MAITAHCVKTAHLNISFCILVTDASITSLICAHGTQLTHLIMYGCDELTALVLTAIARHCTCMRALNIQGCDKIANPSSRVMRMLQRGRSSVLSVQYEDGEYKA
jgi:hypothetical protein